MPEQKFIIGFMGSGKTTIGSCLAQKKSFVWIDLDQEIEKRENKSIPQIFKESGEAYFRDVEHTLLKEYMQESRNLIVSTGGGVIERQENRELLKEKDSIFLHWPFETLYERIAQDKNRPLAKNHEGLHTLYLKRLPLYHQAAANRIDCEGKSIEEIIKEIGEKK